MKKVYDRDPGYFALRLWVDLTTRRCFRRVEVKGLENVPRDGAVLLSPNHCGTLMDALVVLQSFKDGTLFGARADVFRKKAAAKVLHFLKILPVPRIRDGAREVLGNRETMAEAVDALAHGMRYCIFPEGTHRPWHSLQPLRKGLVRTALLARDTLDKGTKVWIVPAGLYYSDHYRMAGKVRLTYGEPIELGGFIRSWEEAHAGQENAPSEAALYNALLAELSSRMKGLLRYIPGDEDYEARWAFARIESTRRHSGLFRRPEATREDCAKALEATREQLDEALAFDRRRRAAGVSMLSIGVSPLALLWRVPVALLTLPLFAYAAVVASPMWVPSELFVSRKIKDKAFGNSIRLLFKLLLQPLLAICWAVAAFLLLSWPVATAALIAALFSHWLFYFFLEFWRLLVSDFRSLFFRR